MNKAKVIAEIGCNHMGNLNIAKEMINTAAIFCKAPYVKFQKRCVKELLSEKDYKAPHPVPQNAFGKTYGEHREALEFTVDQHKILKEYCEIMGVTYSTSVWDLTSAKEIAKLKPCLIKIPSACNYHKPLLSFLADEFGGEIHISIGMTLRKEEEEIINFFEKKCRAKDIVIYSCTSGYPVPFEDVSLLEIARLKETYGGLIKEVGFSGHHNGIAIDCAAYTLGANWVERHFTLDRTWKGTDHAASLEPDGLRRLVRDLKALELALRFKNEEILPIEQQQRIKLKEGQIKWEK